MSDRPSKSLFIGFLFPVDDEGIAVACGDAEFFFAPLYLPPMLAAFAFGWCRGVTTDHDRRRRKSLRKITPGGQQLQTELGLVSMRSSLLYKC